MNRLIKGNEAVVIGALYAGCELYFGYPITPASEIGHAGARWFPAVGRVFLQAECETASISMMYGAAGAGKLSMTATSGPGFSLMQEILSHMAGAELPGVVVNVMRCGPGLGNVYPEQSDYNQAVKGGGHGNYQSIVVAPASVQEMCDLTMMACALSLKYRNPAIVLVDGLQGQMMETLTLPEHALAPADLSDWAAEGTASTRGHYIKSICLDPIAQETLNIKLQEKYAAMTPEARWESYRCDDAELILVAYGISSRIARSAADKLRQEGIRVGVFRPITLMPFPEKALCDILQGHTVLVLELSAEQFADDVRLHLTKGGISDIVVNVYTRMGGVIISVEETISHVKELLK